MATIILTSGADSSNGTPEADSIQGLGGNDTIFGGEGDDTIEGGEGDDRLNGLAGADLLDGGADADQLTTDDEVAIDTLVGGAGADTLNAHGIHVLDGGTGFDRAFINLYGHDEGITADLRALDGGGVAVLSNGLSLTDIEAVDLWLQGYLDDIAFAPMEHGARISTFGGDDSVVGGDGDDTLDGGSSDPDGAAGDMDTVTGGLGDDVLRGGEGDQLDGGDGVDHFQLSYQFYGAPASPVDLSDFSTGVLVLSDGTRVENCESGKIIFGVGQNVVTYGTADHLTVDGGSGSDSITGGAGADRIIGSYGGDTLTGGIGQDVLEGSDGDDLLRGGRGGDVLKAGAGHDFLAGGRGRDVLRHGSGHDTLSGGLDADIFQVGAQVTGDNSTLSITDLTNDDRIDLNKVDADSALAGDQSFALITGEFTDAGQARLIFDGVTTWLELNVSAGSGAEAQIALDGDHTDFTNFVL